MKNINDETLISMLFGSEVMETKAIQYLIGRNTPVLRKFVFSQEGNSTDVSTVLNDSLLILIRNIRIDKFKKESSLNTYFVGICKLVWLNRKKKKYALKYNYQGLDEFFSEDRGEVSSSILHFEELDEQKEKLRYIFSLITGKCKDVLVQWSQGFSMKEIKDNLGYKNAQIVVNKKNTCLKRIMELLKK